LGTLNPFRYRGYVYDEETGLYYLRSRYYNPVWGRFLNADVKAHSKGCLLNANEFCYCRNSPLQYSDYSGNDISIATLEVLLEYTEQNWNNPKVITTEVFLSNWAKFVSHRPHYTYEQYACAASVAKNLPVYQSATGATTIFRDYTVVMGYISDIGGKEGLIPGMLVGIYDENDPDDYPYNHIGVFAGTTFENGQTKYWVYESTRSGGGAHLAEFDAQKWNVWGWHKAVVFSKIQYLELFYTPLRWLVQDTDK